MGLRTQNRDQWGPSRTPGILPDALGKHKYRLERQTGTFETAPLTQASSLFGTGWSFQPVPLCFYHFFRFQFYLIYLLLFILSELLRVPKLYSTICPLVVLEFKEYSKLTKNQRQTYN
jgi:hypothetical protein